MDQRIMSTSRYEYAHKIGEWPSKVVDFHCVRVLRRRRGLVKTLRGCSSIAVVISSPFMFINLQDESAFFVLGCLLTVAMLLRSTLGKHVDKESVVILPAFGVQLETHYVSGSVIRRFVPIDKILKPILSECVTPVTCYWSLALLLHGEDELMLVFKELHPPLKMLAPIWRALCAATDS